VARDIDLRDLTRVMKVLGFQEVRRSGSHLIYRHGESGLVVTLPGGRPKVPMGIAMAIIRQIENYEISSREEVLKKLKAA
jgi:predicted RNA binding protein YcfA (HicA-like mRNA interferase family)